MNLKPSLTASVFGCGTAALGCVRPKVEDSACGGTQPRAAVPQIARLAVFAVTMAFAFGCAPGGLGLHTPLKNMPEQAPGERTLYQRLGGEPAISAFVDDWIDRAVKDPNVNFIRSGQSHEWPATADNLARVKAYFSQYIGMLTGGPQIYSGRDMLTTHTGMRISEGEWISFLGDGKKTLEGLGIADPEKTELLKLLAGTHDTVVDK